MVLSIFFLTWLRPCRRCVCPLGESACLWCLECASFLWWPLFRPLFRGLSCRRGQCAWSARQTGRRKSAAPFWPRTRYVGGGGCLVGGWGRHQRAGCDTVWLYCVTCARYAVAAREGVMNCSGLCCGGRSHVFLLRVAVSARIALVPSPSLPCRPPPPAAAVLPRTDPLPAGIDGRCSGAHGRPQGQAKKGTRANAHFREAMGEGRCWGERGEGRVEPL